MPSAHASDGPPRGSKPQKYLVPQKPIVMSPNHKVGKLPVTKLEGAERQLEGAITMWFNDGDAVCICTLAHAAHQVLRDLNAHVRSTFAWTPHN